jgi:hypothetical protein
VHPVVISCEIMTRRCVIDSELLIHSVILSVQPSGSNGFIATFFMYCHLYPVITKFPIIPYVDISGITNQFMASFSTRYSV